MAHRIENASGPVYSHENSEADTAATNQKIETVSESIWSDTFIKIDAGFTKFTDWNSGVRFTITAGKYFGAQTFRSYISLGTRLLAMFPSEAEYVSGILQDGDDMTLQLAGGVIATGILAKSPMGTIGIHIEAQLLGDIHADKFVPGIGCGISLGMPSKGGFSFSIVAGFDHLFGKRNATGGFGSAEISYVF